MLNSEVQQLELLSTVDQLRQRVAAWTDRPTDWEQVRASQALLRRVADRLESLRLRVEAPLVVATFGGTGTGKSSLVNALVGEEVTRPGRQRPTTQRPVLIAHPRVDLHLLGIPLDDVDIVQRDADLMRDVILLDCPDPDTSEGADPGSNIDRLRSMLPFCDVLLYVSTQQKYRSARVSEELLSAASGCRIIFVQTHASLDENITEDWKQTLKGTFEVPEIYFVDSHKAMQEQQQGLTPTGDMGRLLSLLQNKLGASERVRIRRINVLELLSAGLQRASELLQEKQPAVEELQRALSGQQQALSRDMAAKLEDDLLSSHRLWERRLISAVIDHWGISPFSTVLRVYNGLGSLLASTALFRVRSTAQLAILGTVQGVRWLDAKRREQAAESSLARASQFGITNSMLLESEIVIRGHLASAGLDPQVLRASTVESMRNHVCDVEDHFVGSASQGVDTIIKELSLSNSRWWIRLGYELILTAYLGFVIGRVAKNFFVDSFLWEKAPLGTDFYLAAGLLLLLICGVLVAMFTRRLRRGLNTRIRELSARLVDVRLGACLFPQLDRAIHDLQHSQDELRRMLMQTEQLRNEIARTRDLGGRS
jgi:Predicted GTPase